MLVRNPRALCKFSHLVDEVHENTSECELLLVIAKMTISDGDWKGKMVLMSATVNVNFFSFFSRL